MDEVQEAGHLVEVAAALVVAEAEDSVVVGDSVNATVTLEVSDAMVTQDFVAMAIPASVQAEVATDPKEAFDQAAATTDAQVLETEVKDLVAHNADQMVVVIDHVHPALVFKQNESELNMRQI